MRKKLACFTLAGSLALAAAAPVLASPQPPTNGGNGAGKSGQCTGPQDERPKSCKSQGGPGNQP